MGRILSARVDHIFPSALRVPSTDSQSTMASSAGVAAAPIDAGGGEGGGGGGAEPDLKKRRLLDAGGPIEDDETARQKMRDARVYGRGVDGTRGEFVGFDPDNVADLKSAHWDDHGPRQNPCIKPMGYFAGMGDLPMMRWLYVNGADTRDEMVTSDWFPMCTAAMVGNLGVCKWLFQHGAAGDVKRIGSVGFNLLPLSAIFRQWDKRELSRWLILRGTLCDSTGDLDVDLIRSSLGFPASFLVREQFVLMDWAKEHHQSRSSFDVFLMGTLPPPTYSATKLRDELLAKIGIPSAVDRILAIAPPDQCRLLWDDLFAHRVCNLSVFSGKSGILELIGAYVGTMRGREARIVRQLAERLPGIIAELERMRNGVSDECFFCKKRNS